MSSENGRSRNRVLSFIFCVSILVSCMVSSGSFNGDHFREVLMIVFCHLLNVRRVEVDIFSVNKTRAT